MRSSKTSALGDMRFSRTGITQFLPVCKNAMLFLPLPLYQAALVASSRNKHFLAYFTNKLRGREKGKGIKTMMRVKLSTKMMIIAWTLMKKKEFFDPKYLNIE